MPYLAVAIGGFIGAILRYGISEWLGSLNGVNVATLLTNLVGCFVLGWLNTVTANRLPIHPHVRLGIGTGLIGAFTTFSTFTIDGWKLYQNGQIGAALLYIVLSLAGGLICTAVGVRLGNRMESQVTRKT